MSKRNRTAIIVSVATAFLLAVALIVAMCSAVPGGQPYQPPNNTPVTEDPLEPGSPPATDNPSAPGDPSIPDGPPEPVDPTAVHTEALDMTVSVIDVGQGDSILIQSEGEALLVDAGRGGKNDAVVAYCQARGVDEIDYLVATHPDADHIGGMAGVLDAFDVAHNIITPTATSTSQAYRGFVAAVENEPGVTFTTPAVGARYVLGDATIEVLSNGDGQKNTNDASIVLKVICGGKSVLLTGDASMVVESRLIASDAPLDSDVLKVAHHGSRNSTGDAFIEAVSPEYAVISVGATNGYGHPHVEVVDRLSAFGARICYTDASGTIEFLFSDGEITLLTA
jgi:beta-lactamase superfamily II metal-dependent hydrolase